MTNRKVLFLNHNDHNGHYGNERNQDGSCNTIHLFMCVTMNITKGKVKGLQLCKSH